MSKSTGGKEGSNSDSDNNSKGSNSSNNSSESKGSTRSEGSSRSESNSSAKDSSPSASPSSSPSTDSAPTSSGAPTASVTQESAARATLDTSTQENYNSLVRGAVTPAPVRDAVGVDVSTNYGTTMSDSEMGNLFSQASHLQKAEDSWNAGGVSGMLDWAGNRIGAAVDEAQGWGYRQARELSQAPLDKVADIARNPAVQGIAMLAGGLPGLALTSAVGIADSVADYAQDELSGKEAAVQGLGDVMAFAPAPVKTVYGFATNPIATAKRVAGQTIQTGNPLADMALGKITNIGIDNFGGNFMASDEDVRGPGLTAARMNADNSFTSSVSSRSGGMPFNKPQVMNNDAMTLHWKMLAQQEANRPKYNQSMLFALGNRTA